MMLLGQKKDQEREKNWCVVLKSLENEIDKKKVSQKVSEFFSISSEEAWDLVASTPIILLDNLTHPVASKIHDYFQSLGAQMTLSNDALFKRKCYRTVWPQAPTLSFLQGWAAESPVKPLDTSQEVLDPQEALNEVRSLAREKFTGAPVLQEKKSFEAAESFEMPRPVSRMEDGNKIQEIQALFEDAEERYDALKEEYREARHVFEEKLSLVKKENHELQQKIEETKVYLRSLEKEQEHLQIELGERKAALQAIQSDKEGETAQLRVQCQALEKALAQSVGSDVGARSPRPLSSGGETPPLPLAPAQPDPEGFRKVAWTRLENHLLAIQLLQMKQQDLLQNIFEGMTPKGKGDVQEPPVSPDPPEALSQGEGPSVFQWREIADRLDEKQSALKHLVDEQKRMEKEIRDREDSMRRILTDQETVEREILEAKQAQHRLERERPLDPS